MDARRIIPIEVKDEYIIGAGRVIGAKGSHDDVVLRAAFNDMWDGTSKTAVWLNAIGEQAVVQMILPDAKEDGAYLIPIPEEAKSEVGDAMLTIKGFTTADGVTEGSATITATAYFRVLDGDFDQGASDSGSITLNQSEQFQAQLTAIEADIINAAKAADAKEAAERFANDAEGYAADADSAAQRAEAAAQSANAAVYEAENWAQSSADDAQTAKTMAQSAETAAGRAETAAESASESAGRAQQDLKTIEEDLLPQTEEFSNQAQVYRDEAADAKIAAQTASANASRSATAANASADAAAKEVARAETAAERSESAAQRAESVVGEIEGDIGAALDKKLDKTGGTLTGDLNVGNADINVENGNIGVSDLFFNSAVLNSDNIRIKTDEGKITLSLRDGLTFEDYDGNVKRLGGLDYITEPDPNAVMFSEMEEYVEEAIDSAKVETDNHTIIYNKDGKLSVNTADEVGDNTLPITAAAVNTTVGNIEVLLKTI